MLIGFNNDVEHRGLIFHIQTEDHGEVDCRIETQLFYSGAILDTLITSYQEAIDDLDSKAAEERIRAQMKASHRSLFKKLRAGEYDELVGLDPLEEGADSGVIEADAQDFTPSQDRVPAQAQQIEEGGEEALLEFEKKHEMSKKEGSHVSLDKLKDQLSALKQPTSEPSVVESVDEEDLALATQIMDAGGFGLDFSSELTAQRAAEQQAAGLPDLPETGVSAWTGCKVAEEDLSLAKMVEAFLRA